MIEQMRMEIAKERFLELMGAHPNGDPSGAAVLAIEQAGDFMRAYDAIHPQPEALMYGQPVSAEKKMKGCRACFGSGGKAGNPCKACHGIGKVPT